MNTAAREESPIRFLISALVLLIVFVAILLLISGCNTVTAQCVDDLQHTDHPTLPYRDADVCTKAGYDGALTRTKCRSATPLDKDHLPAACR